MVAASPHPEAGTIPVRVVASTSVSAADDAVSERSAVNFAAVLADSTGASGELALEIPEWEEPAKDLEERAWRALHEVSDPEFPISVVDLGLITGIEVRGDELIVGLTFTASACPCTDFIEWDVRERLLQEPGVASVRVEVGWDPPWTTERITEHGRRALRKAGVSV